MSAARINAVVSGYCNRFLLDIHKNNMYELRSVA